MADLKKPIVGQRLASFPGNTFAKLVDGEFRDRQRGELPGPPPAPDAARSPALVRLSWPGTMDPLPPGRLVGLGDPLLQSDDIDEAPWRGVGFVAGVPGIDRVPLTAITLGPLAPNGIGWGYVPGAVWAKVDVPDDLLAKDVGAQGYAAHDLEVAGSLFAWKEFGGHHILWKDPGAGERWAIIDVATSYTWLVIQVRKDGGVSTADIDVPFNAFIVFKGDHDYAMADTVFGGLVATPDENYKSLNLMLAAFDDLALVIAVADEFGQIFALQPLAAEGEGEFPGWPGPTPGTGTTTMMLLYASVNDATDVAASDGTFAFDGATVAGGLGPASGAPSSGTCSNCGHAFTNDEKILVAGDGTTWQAFKLTTNWLKAKVNVSGGVAAGTGSFTFDNITALVGTATAVGSPVAINAPGVEWNDNEDFTAYQRADGDWQPIKGNWNYFIRVRGQAVGAMTAANTTWTIDNVELLQGDMPKLSSGALGFTNIAMIPAANNAVIELRWNQNNARWETEPIACHMILGEATGDGATTVDHVELICGSDPRTDPSSTSETVTFVDPWDLTIEDNMKLILTKKANGDWMLMGAPCPTGA